MQTTFLKIRDDLKHLYNTSKEQRVKDFLAGMILELNNTIIQEEKELEEMANFYQLQEKKAREFMKEQEFLAQDVL